MFDTPVGIGLTALKLLVVLYFFYRFLRNSLVVEGIGLLTATTALLLDAGTGIFGSEILSAQLGFFLQLLRGGLFAGAAIWLWGVLRPFVSGESGSTTSLLPTSDDGSFTATESHASAARLKAENPAALSTIYDRRQMFQQIRTRLGRGDVLDLIFDLGLNENDLMGLDRDMNGVIVRLMDAVEREGRTGELALAVERILLPPAADTLPRQQHLKAQSPPTIWRHYLLTNYSAAELQLLAEELGIDLEQISLGSKKDQVRGFLLYLYRRGQMDQLAQRLADLEEE